MHVLSCFVQLKGVRLITCVFWIFIQNAGSQLCFRFFFFFFFCGDLENIFLIVNLLTHLGKDITQHITWRREEHHCTDHLEDRRVSRTDSLIPWKREECLTIHRLEERGNTDVTVAFTSESNMHRSIVYTKWMKNSYGQSDRRSNSLKRNTGETSNKFEHIWTFLSTWMPLYTLNMSEAVLGFCRTSPTIMVPLLQSSALERVQRWTTNLLNGLHDLGYE